MERLQAHWGSLWHKLPEGLVESAKLPEAIFTPSTKAEHGHDENITEDQVRDLIGAEQTALLRDVVASLPEAHDYARNATSSSPIRSLSLAWTRTASYCWWMKC